MGQKDVPPFFAFYPYEFLSDERVLAMSLQQIGAYLLLIISQWINGSIPADVPTLARILKQTPEDLESLWAGVAPCFGPHPEMEGRLIQKRVEVERSKAISAMETERERKKKYREAKRDADGTRTIRGQDRDSPGPSTLISSSYISTSSKKKEEEQKHAAQWEEFCRLYPTHKFDEVRAGLAWAAADDPDAIIDGLKAWIPSEAWKDRGGRFVNHASRFISEGVYKMRPQAEDAAVIPPKPWKPDW